MKKTLLAILYLLVSASVFVSAQNNQCVMCGTWEGIYTFPMPASAPEGGFEDVQFKRIIRIEQYGTDYIVRVKDMPISNPTDVHYWNECYVTYSDDEKIDCSSYVSTDYDWDNTKKNGKVISSAKYEFIFSLLFKAGRIAYVGHLHTTYMDVNGAVICTHDNPTERIPLYNEDDNW